MIRAVVEASILVRALLKPQGSVGPVLTRLREAVYGYVLRLPQEFVTGLAGG